MDYVAPYSSADPNTSYVDANTPGAVRGSRVPGLALEMPQREIKTVIVAAGLTPDKTDPTQLNEAIDLKIALATGGGENPLNDLMTLLRSKMLVFPEVLTSDGKLPVTSPSTGTVRVLAGYSFRHRGVFDITTAQTDFATVANKTYHLRWNPTDGLQLKDLADTVGYNPASVAETSEIFDSSYDSMLIARVVTNASNIATITLLANKVLLELELTKTTYQTVSGTGASDGRGPDTAPVQTVNWARKPVCHWQEWKVGPGTAYLIDTVVNVFFEATRYTCRPQVIGVYTSNSLVDQGTVDGSYRVILRG